MVEIAQKKLKDRHGGLTALTPKHEQVLALLVHGDEGEDRPLTAIEVADRLKVRRAYVRDLMADPLFKSRYQAAVAADRAATQPMVLSKLKAIVASPIVEPKPSDIIRAGQILLGEDAKGFSVNVQVNNQTNNTTTIRPGYVLDLSALHGQRHRGNEPVTIEGNADE